LDDWLTALAVQGLMSSLVTRHASLNSEFRTQNSEFPGYWLPATFLVDTPHPGGKIQRSRRLVNIILLVLYMINLFHL